MKALFHTLQILNKMDVNKELEFSKTERKVGVAELIESKERDNDFVSCPSFQVSAKGYPVFPWPWRTCHFLPSLVEGIKKAHSSLKPQAFDELNDLCTKAQDLNKRRSTQMKLKTGGGEAKKK